MEDVADIEHDPGEHFVTALLMDIPDQDRQAEVINCGHPPPLLVHGRQVMVLKAGGPAPPLGLCDLPVPPRRTDPAAYQRPPPQRSRPASHQRLTPPPGR